MMYWHVLITDNMFNRQYRQFIHVIFVIYVFFLE